MSTKALAAAAAAAVALRAGAAWEAGVSNNGLLELNDGAVVVLCAEDAEHPGGIALLTVSSKPESGDWTLDALADIERDTGLVPTAIGPSFVSSRDGRLKSFAIPSTVRTLGPSAFSGCVGATNALVLPAGLEKLGTGAFWICENVTGDLVIPAGVETIGPETFYGCEKLTGLSFAPGSKLKSIELSNGSGRAGAFVKCRGLRGTIDFSPCAELAFIDPTAFAGTPLGFDSVGPVERFVFGEAFLRRKAAELQAGDATNGYPRASTDWFSGSFGVSSHWTFATTDQNGETNDFEAAVDAFDVPRYVAQVKRTGAKHVIFTATHSFHLPAPSAAVDAVTPGRTTKRNLLAELGDALHAEGIRLLLYFNYGCSYPQSYPYPDDEWMIPVGFKDGRLEDFGTNEVAIVTDIARTLGKRVDGWWFDSSAIACERGMYRYDTGVEIGDYQFPFRGIALGCKAGNPDAIVTFNSQGGTFLYTPCQEYFSGEEMWKYPLCGRTNDQGMQMHVWGTMDNPDWVHEGTDFARLRFSDADLAAFVRSRTADGCAVTLNLEIDRTGLMSPEAVAQLERLAAADAAAPRIAAASADSVAATAATVSVSLSDLGEGSDFVTVSVAVDGTTQSETYTAAGSKNFAFAGLADGTAYTATVTATGSNGKVATTTVAFTTKAYAAPTIDAATAGAIATDAATVSVSLSGLGEGSASATVAVALNGTTKSETYTAAGSKDFAFTGLAAGTAYTAAVTATGSNGKVAATSVSFTTAREPKPAGEWFAVTLGTAPYGSWPANDPDGTWSGAVASAKLDGSLLAHSNTLRFTPDPASTSGSNVVVSGSIKVAPCGALPVVPSGAQAGIAFVKNQAAVDSYVLASGAWTPFEHGFAPPEEGSMLNWKAEFKLNEANKKVRYTLGPSTGEWRPLPGVSRVIAVEYAGAGAFGSFRGRYATLAVVELPDKVTFSADGTGIALDPATDTLSLTISDAVEGIHYTVFASESLQGTYTAVAPSATAPADGALSFENIAADTPSKFLKVVASDEPFAAGDPLP